jgi:hypothetical protein
MKKLGILLCILFLLLAGCGGESVATTPSDPTDFTVWLNMGLTYPTQDSLPDGQGQEVDVILLLGQSNATGCSLTSYLQKDVTAEEYAAFEAGYPTVLINYCMDDHKYTTEGAFIPTGLNCGAGEGYFGPELGIAEVLANADSERQTIILKYTMSGYSLHHHWLCDSQRGSIYEACMAFVTTYMDQLAAKNYDAKISAICWMQGESDTTDFKASRYLENQAAFASYLRSDLTDFAKEGGIYFIDAGISSSPYCLPAYPAINEAKEQFAALSPLNLYFSTIDAGFTTLNEPEGNPDLGHYDAWCELELGRTFGQLILQAEQLRQAAQN